MKTCPRCAEDVKSAALMCRFCGYDFQPNVAPAVALPKDGALAAEATTAPAVLVAGVAANARLVPAGFFRRLAAYLIDVVGLYLPIIFIWIGMGSPGGDATNILAAAYFVGLGAYFLYFWNRGATLGMRALGMKVVDENGNPPNLALAISRLIALVVTQLVILIVLPLILFVIFRIFRRPLWLDTVSHTRVVLTPSSG